MRKMKKINGYLVVRFNDREKREYEGTGLGNFGVIDAELYTGILDVDRSVMEYDDIETLEIALEQARGLESELDVVEPEVKITVIIEGETEVSEEDVEPESLFKERRATLEGQLKTGQFSDLDPRTAAHELYGYTKALEDLGMIDGHDERFLVERNTFGEVCNLYTDEGHRVNVALPSRAGLAIVSPHDFEEGETFTGCTVQTLKCRRCGMESFAWSKELKDQFSSNREAEAKPYHRPCMMELRSIMREWQQKNSAPLSALKICVEAFLAEERKRLLISHPVQE